MTEQMTPREAQMEIASLTLNRMDVPVVAHVALTVLAADTLEYRVEHQHIENGVWHPVTKWSPEWPLHEGHTVAPDERIMCRRVSQPWEVAG